VAPVAGGTVVGNPYRNANANKHQAAVCIGFSSIAREIYTTSDTMARASGIFIGEVVTFRSPAAHASRNSQGEFVPCRR
jgi:hypothetical protein